MSDNKLLAIFSITVVSGLIIAGIMDKVFEKSEHEIRMEKIQELDAIREVMRKSESDIEMLKIRREIDSMCSEIESM